ncbi:MAG TPA: SRPBCC domain-containing protein [Anaerolineae bacterium]|nr:SRPBCC domain-containing protein [Anaerolineae bacterium]
MASEPSALRLQRLVNAPPAETFRMFTHPVALRDWLCDAAQVDPQKGGRLYLWWGSGAHATGAYTTFEPGKRLAMEWHHSREPEPARVRIAFAAKDGGTQVTLAHALGSGPKWRKVAPAVRKAWESALENLQSALETGIDLRVARLPRLGILIDDFNTEIAARLGVPVDKGIRLAGVADGAGAQAAGLQKDDVLVKLGGKKASDFPSLVAALQGRLAGDVVPVVFYRGDRKMSAPMELSKRPQAEMPPRAELVDRVRKSYSEIDAGFAKLVEGVSEDQAGNRPSPDAWSVKDAIAHFILTERDLQSWFAQMVNDREIGESLEFRPNVEARVRAVREVHPALGALLDELKRSERETVAMLSALPAEFVARKHLYRRVTGWMLEVLPGHFYEEHLGLMQAAIQSARQK